MLTMQLKKQRRRRRRERDVVAYEECTILPSTMKSITNASSSTLLKITMMMGV
jgi:hypothetical protein